MKKQIPERIMWAARGIVERAGGIYELFETEADVRAFIDGSEDEDEPIWVRRRKACEAIIAYDELPCIFDTMECQTEAEITEDGFWFDSRHYE